MLQVRYPILGKIIPPARSPRKGTLRLLVGAFENAAIAGARLITVIVATHPPVGSGRGNKFMHFVGCRRRPAWPLLPFAALRLPPGGWCLLCFCGCMHLCAFHLLCDGVLPALSHLCLEAWRCVCASCRNASGGCGSSRSSGVPLAWCTACSVCIVWRVGCTVLCVL